MEHQGNYIKFLLKDRGLSQEDLAKNLKLSRGTISQRLSHPVYPDTDEKIEITKILNLTPDEINRLNEMGGNAIGLSYIDDEQVSEFREVSPGRYRMKVELVPIYAQAGYLLGYCDPQYLEDLPVHYFTTNQLAKGKYRAFEVYGDSMDNGNINEAIPSGITIIGREVDRQYWKSKLHNHKWKNWIFVHKTDGIIVKQIESQNLENGDIILTSLNPDKNKYPNFKINLDDVSQIYNVIKRELDF